MVSSLIHTTLYPPIPHPASSGWYYIAAFKNKDILPHMVSVEEYFLVTHAALLHVVRCMSYCRSFSIRCRQNGRPGPKPSLRPRWETGCLVASGREAVLHALGLTFSNPGRRAQNSSTPQWAGNVQNTAILGAQWAASWVVSSWQVAVFFVISYRIGRAGLGWVER